MKVYLSGRMSGLEDHGASAFASAARTVRKAYPQSTVISPAEMPKIEGDMVPWAKYLARDLKCVCECDYIAVLPGWWRSRGASLEVLVGYAMGRDVLRVDESHGLVPESWLKLKLIRSLWTLVRWTILLPPATATVEDMDAAIRGRRHPVLRAILLLLLQASLMGAVYTMARGPDATADLPSSHASAMADGDLLNLERNVILQALGTVIHLHVVHRGEYPNRDHLDLILEPFLSEELELPNEIDPPAPVPPRLKPDQPVPDWIQRLPEHGKIAQSGHIH